ncbi:uncharacterized protein CBL_12139 [Carabus blaptoides fortunei]
MYKFFCLASVFSIISVTQCLDSLPPYIKKCSKSQSETDGAQCIVNSANAAIPHLIKGDKKYHFPTFDPLKITEIVVDPSPNFHMSLKNVDIFGFEGTNITRADIKTLDNGYQFTLDIDIANLELHSIYTTKGKILILPIEGEGPCVLKINGQYNYTVTLERYQKKGVSYFKVGDNHITYTLSGLTFKLDNLFGGNAKLGEEMNKFLNENWRDLREDFHPTIAKTISSIIEQILSDFLTLIPEDVLFNP